MTRSGRARHGAPERRPVQLFGLLVGAAFLLFGVLGFVPGVTTGYEALRFAGPDSGAMLLGVFGVSVLHNLVHVAFGVVGVASFWIVALARGFLVVGGGVYLLLWVYGLAIDHGSTANVIPVNSADNWLHLGLGLGMIALGVAGTAVDRSRGVYPPASAQGG